jgi:hypothetical protein
LTGHPRDDTPAPDLAVCSRGIQIPAPAPGSEEIAVKENFSLIIMCVFMLFSLAFLAQQITSYH